jgi:hypothetical protein
MYPIRSDGDLRFPVVAPAEPQPGGVSQSSPAGLARSVE